MTPLDLYWIYGAQDCVSRDSRGIETEPVSNIHYFSKQVGGCSVADHDIDRKTMCRYESYTHHSSSMFHVHGSR